MVEAQAKHRRRIYTPLVLVALIIVFGLLAKGTYGAYKKSQISADARSAYEKELSEIVARKASLEANTARLKSENGVEAEIREKFQVVKPGEEVIVVVPPKKK